MDNEQTSLFRKESVESIQSPEQLNVARLDSFALGVADVRNGEVVVIFDDAQVGKNVETGMTLTIGEGEYPITSVGYMEDGNVFALSSADLADGLYEARVVFRTTQVLRLLFN